MIFPRPIEFRSGIGEEGKKLLYLQFEQIGYQIGTPARPIKYIGY